MAKRRKDCLIPATLACACLGQLGAPAIALPAGIGPSGLPIGIQLVAPFGEDLKLLRIAKWCETSLAIKLAN